MLGFDFQKIAQNDRFASQFEDLGPIGSGGFAQVRKARNKIDGKIYALKIITLKPTHNHEETEQHFYRALSELKIHSQLHHPQILKYHGCWMELQPYSPEQTTLLQPEQPCDPEFQMVVQDDSFGSDGFVFASADSSAQQNTPTSSPSPRPSDHRLPDGSRLNDYKEIKLIMLTEPCELNLQTLLYERSQHNTHKHEPQPERDWIQNYEMALEMTKGLTYLHSKRIIHRDIKLHNILLQDGHCKLIDFGLARKAKFWKSSIQEHNRNLSQQLTPLEEQNQQFSKSVGTRLFSSPEQATSEKYDHRTDIFSLAIVIVLLFSTFSTVHEQRELLEVIRQRKLQHIHIPQKLKAVLYQCLGPENERPPLSELQNVLRELLRESRCNKRLMPLGQRQSNLNSGEKFNELVTHDLKAD